MLRKGSRVWSSIVRIARAHEGFTRGTRVRERERERGRTVMAAGLGKRERTEQDWDVSEVEECPSATVHGVVTQVSPVKTSRRNPSVRYFDGRITDGKKSVRVVCFDPSMRSALEDARATSSSISVENCNVKISCWWQQERGGDSDHKPIQSAQLPAKVYRAARNERERV